MGWILVVMYVSGFGFATATEPSLDMCRQQFCAQYDASIREAYCLSSRGDRVDLQLLHVE